MNSVALRQSILATLTYFDVTDFPLTREELYRFLWQPPAVSYTDFCYQLDVLVENEVLPVVKTRGFYHLRGRERVVDLRECAVVYTERKLRRAALAIRLIKYVPFLRAVFVCNSVGREVARPESDIDFLIVTEIKRVWIVRLFTNMLLRIFGLRTYGKHERDRICLSFYVASDQLDLAPRRAVTEDVHFAYWMHQMVPLFDPGAQYDRFLAVNHWVKPYLPHAQAQSTSRYMSASKLSWWGRGWKMFWETVWRGAYGDLIEMQARELQWMKLKLDIKEKAQVNDNGVILESGILKFHEHDARRKIYEAWSARKSEYVVAKNT